MMRIRRAQWIASFDMEDLVSSILRDGMLVSMSLVISGLMVQRLCHGQIEEQLQGTNALQLVLADLRRIGPAARWPSILVHVGIAGFMVTPYVRVFASMLYFAKVQRSWKHALMTGLVLATLTYVLFLG